MDKKDQPFPRDRDGVIFENDLTEENEPSPERREEAAHDLAGDPGIDSQAGDDFMRERKFPHDP
ncbi:MAG TPA: hypothetical protein VIJ77_05780 [Candidatus Tumulicola sp.]|jgi:hypothetical protein